MFLVNLLQNIKNLIKKVDWKIITIIILIFIIIFLTRSCNEKEIVEIPIKIEVPVPVVKNNFDTIYKPQPITVENPLNIELLNKYKKAKDSLEKFDIFKESIKEREYNEKFEDTFQIINVYTKTQGKILKQTTNYKTKPYNIKVDTIINIPIKKTNQFFTGVELGVPAENLQDLNLVFKGNLMFKNKKDNVLTLSFDTEKRVWLGYAIKL